MCVTCSCCEPSCNLPPPKPPLPTFPACKHFWCTSVSQTMCSYLAASSAWPVLAGHRKLITLAAGMLLHFNNEGDLTFLVHSPFHYLQRQCRLSPVCVRSSYAACPVLVLRVITWFCIQLLPMPPEAAGACAPGVPDSSELSLLDIVCIHAAACDLAIADVGFRTICTEDVSVIASLYESPREARRVAPKHPEVEGLLALMDFQVARLMAADIQVRRLGSKSCVMRQQG